MLIKPPRDEYEATLIDTVYYCNRALDDALAIKAAAAHTLARG